MEFAPMGRKILPSLKLVFFIIVLVLIISTTLIRYFDNISWLDSFFMVIDSMTHAHFGGYPQNTNSKLVMTFMTIFGYALLVYFISFLVEFFLSGEILEAMGMRRIDKEIGQLKDHIILCGYGRVGSVVGNELIKNKIPFVVIDNDPEVIDNIRSDNILLALKGDATDVSMMRKAGIAKANFLVTVLGDDSETIVAILTAKEANPSIRIIARAGSENMARRMFQIGAERIILPEYVGGLEIAQSIVHKQLGKTRGLFSVDDFLSK